MHTLQLHHIRSIIVQGDPTSLDHASEADAGADGDGRDLPNSPESAGAQPKPLSNISDPPGEVRIFQSILFVTESFLFFPVFVTESFFVTESLSDISGEVRIFQSILFVTESFLFFPVLSFVNFVGGVLSFFHK